MRRRADAQRFAAVLRDAIESTSRWCAYAHALISRVIAMGSGGFGFVAPVVLVLVAAAILFIGIWLLMRRL